MYWLYSSKGKFYHVNTPKLLRKFFVNYENRVNTVHSVYTWFGQRYFTSKYIESLNVTEKKKNVTFFYTIY